MSWITHKTLCDSIEQIGFCKIFFCVFIAHDILIKYERVIRVLVTTKDEKFVHLFIWIVRLFAQDHQAIFGSGVCGSKGLMLNAAHISLSFSILQFHYVFVSLIISQFQFPLLFLWNENKMNKKKKSVAIEYNFEPI